jgi:RNA polymerase sigma factor (sigma-70 family)
MHGPHRGPGDVSAPSTSIEDLLRPLAPQVLTALVRHHRHFDLCEDAVQEALLAATLQWPGQGVPDDPRAWLIRVASRRVIDQLRSDGARQRRETAVAVAVPADALTAPPADDDAAPGDDTLTLLFLCCHPTLTPASRIALTLRAVGGLTTAEIARAFMVPEATMAQRISRAKQRVRAEGLQLQPPPEAEREERLGAVLHVLYLVFNEGYSATSGDDLQRPELTTEAIRLTRELHRRLPGHPDVTGLLALLLLTDARRPARTTHDGRLVPLAEQDRTRWDREAIAEGLGLTERALTQAPVGSFQIQAAIAALHAEAGSSDDTDWPQIAALYHLLERVAPNPMVSLNRAVAVGMARGPAAGLAVLDDVDQALRDHHRLHAVRGHLQEMAGDLQAARTSYRAAARLTTSVPERRYLEDRLARLRTTASS